MYAPASASNYIDAPVGARSERALALGSCAPSNDPVYTLVVYESQQLMLNKQTSVPPPRALATYSSLPPISVKQDQYTAIANKQVHTSAYIMIFVRMHMQTMTSMTLTPPSAVTNDMTTSATNTYSMSLTH